MSRLNDVVAAQDAGAVRRAWADDKTHVAPDAGGLLHDVFTRKFERNEAAGRTRPMVYAQFSWKRLFGG